MDLSWLTTPWSTVWITLLSAVLIYIAMVVITRINGARTFSKFSSFDLAITIAVGSVLGRALVASDQTLLHTLVAVVALFVLQFGVDYLRSRFLLMPKLIDNPPILLMENAQLLEENLKKARMTPKAVYHELRQANVVKLSAVKAVVLESNGEVSVLHHSDADCTVDRVLLEDVKR